MRLSFLLFYSIPWKPVRKPLTLQANESVIRLLDQSQEVSWHKRCFDKGQRIENPDHLKGLLEQRKKGKAPKGRERILSLVPETETLFRFLLLDQFPEFLAEMQHQKIDLAIETLIQREEQALKERSLEKRFKNSQWPKISPGATCIRAMIDRLIHRSETLTVNGESYRLKEAKERQKNKVERKAVCKTIKTQKRIVESIRRLFDFDSDLENYFFAANYQKIRKRPGILKDDDQRLSEGDQLRIKAAFDMWSGSGHDYLFELLDFAYQILGLKNQIKTLAYPTDERLFRCRCFQNPCEVPLVERKDREVSQKFKR